MKIKQFIYPHSSIDVLFKQSKDNFVVNEVPLYEFSGDGEHLIIQFRKKDLTTWVALEIFAKYFSCSVRDFGYAGLKDKSAMTVQYISINKKLVSNLENFNHENIKILSTTYHNNKIKIGHLKGNNFFIRLKRVLPQDELKISQVLAQIERFGIPNYFGYQRFGILGDNYKKGEEIIQGKLKERKKKLKKLYINAYQSHLFNEWLSKRIEISKLISEFKPSELTQMLGLSQDVLKELKKQIHPFKILEGELMSHYPYGKIFYAEDVNTEANLFYEKQKVPTGLLLGEKTMLSKDLAFKYEKDLSEIGANINGARRFAWIFPQDIKSTFKEDKKHLELEFYLPKGSYATELIAELLHQNLHSNS